MPHAVVDLRPAGESELPRALRLAGKLTSAPSSKTCAATHAPRLSANVLLSCSTGRDLLQAADSGKALPHGVTSSWVVVVVANEGAAAPPDVLQAAGKAGITSLAVLDGGVQAYLKDASHQASAVLLPCTAR